MPNDSDYRYEPLEAFGESLTTRRPWNTQALVGVERLNGRVAMLGFGAVERRLCLAKLRIELVRANPQHQQFVASLRNLFFKLVRQSPFVTHG